MHKKICSYIVVIVFSTSFMFGMERDDVLHELVRKDVISTLSVNDYIVNVSSAYQGLLKEACFKQDILRNMIKTVNTALRQKVAEKSCKGYRLFDQKSTERFFDRSIAYLKIPCFRYMELTYKNASEFERRDDMDAHIKITTFCYYISPIAFNSRQYLCKEKSVKNISALIKNNILRSLPEGSSAYIELYAPGSISDWIKVTNSFESRSCVIRSKQNHSLLKPCEVDKYIDNPFEVDMKVCSLIFGATIIAVMLVGGVLY